MNHMKLLTPSRLRENLYKVLDRIIETGEPVAIKRKGRLLKIVPERGSKLEALKPHPDYILGDPEALVHVD